MSIQNRNIYERTDPATREKLLAAGTMMTCEKGQLLFGENDEEDCLFWVMKGYISLYRNSRYGDIKIIFVCSDGEILNETILENQKTSIAAKTLSDAVILKIPVESVRRLMKEDNGLALDLFESLSYKTRRLYHQTGNANRTYPMEKKLAAKIWKMARDYGRDTEEGRQIAFEITVTMLANMLGAKRETISRDLSKLKKDNYLIHEDGLLTVRNMAALREII